MQFLKFLTLGFATAAVASPLVARADANTVVQDVGVLRQKLVALNNSVTAFDGNLFKALAVQIKSNDVLKAINQTTTDANASPPFGDDGSANVAVAFLDLEPDIFSTLDNLVAKKPTFDSGKIPLSPIVKKSLEDQRAAAAKLGAAITAKLTEDFATVAPGIVKDIDDKFAQAIAVYSSGSSFPGFPSFPGFGSK